jgi:hypothetical protein
MIKTFPVAKMQWHPASQEQRCTNGAYYKYVYIFREEKQSEFHAGVLCMKTTGKFIFSFCKIEWCAVGFCSYRNDKNNKCDNGGNVTFENPPSCLLRFNDG